MSKLNRVSIVNVAGTGSSTKTGASFRLGEMLFGKIVDVAGEAVVLSIGGETYTAKTSLAFSPGESVRLKVEDKDQSRIVLKVVGGLDPAEVDIRA